MKKFFFLILFLFSTGGVLLFGEKAPMKFGEVSMKEMQMTSYAGDTNASAVILCEYGYFDPDEFNFTWLIRIKILKKAGFDEAKKTFPPYKNATVKGITYNLENGVINETKLDSKSIFTEAINARRERLRIAMPNVKVGSVLDIKFMFKGIPDEWEFQHDIPVLHSELVMETSSYISFRIDVSGFEPLKVMEPGHWVAENMPAFKTEPYISSYENFITKITFDILEVSVPGYYASYTTSLEALSDLLWEDEYFGAALRGDGYMSRPAKEIAAKAKSDKEKVKMAYDYMRNFNWNEIFSLYTSSLSIKTALDKKSGNSADLNLALVQLLSQLDLKAEPVLISTRENGFLPLVTPSLTKLNTVIASVDINGELILLDATEPFAPYDLLPPKDLNLFGWNYNKKQSGKVSLMPKKKSKSSVIYNLNLDEELQLTGKLNLRNYDYAALSFRKKYHRFTGKEDFLQSVVEDHPGLRITNSEFENIDSVDLPVNAHYDISLNNFVEDINGEFYLYPMMIHQMKENPFTSDERKYPVDFVYPVEDTYSITINIPEGFEVSSFPKTAKLGLPDNAALFLYQVTVLGKTVQFSCKYSINKTIFTEAEYANVKEFFNQMIAKQAEPVILKKI